MRFRELIQPGTNFEFVGKTRLWLTLSVIAVLFSLAMLPVNYFLRGSPLNFSIDFKGGTDIILTFGKPVSAGDVRKGVKDAGFPEVDISTFKFRDADDKVQDAYLVRVPEFGALTAAEQRKVEDELQKDMGGPQAILKAAWSGDTLYVRSTKALAAADIKAFLDKHSIQMKPWSPEQDKA